MRRWLALAVLVLVGLAGASCTRTSSKAVGRLTVNGRAEVITVDGGRRQVTGSRTLNSREQVRMIDGTGILSLGGGRQLELRKGSSVRLALLEGASGAAEPRGELLSGDVLVLAPTDMATVVSDDTTVRVTSGVARVSKGLAVVTAVYQGGAGVESAGRSASVPALRQVAVPAPGLPSRATPLVYAAGDSWDQRYLGDAIDLGNQLLARSRGFSAQVAASEAASPDFFRRVLPGLASQPFDATLLEPGRPPGETLVGAAVTLLGTKGQFADRWASVFGFHSEGAQWGLVALDQGVARGPLLESVDAAVARLTAQAQLASPAPSPVTGTTARPVIPLPTTPSAGGTTATTTPSASSGGTGGGATGVTGGTGGGSTGTGPTSTLPSDSRGPVDLGLPVLDDTLNTLIDTLSGLLRAIGQP